MYKIGIVLFACISVSLAFHACNDPSGHVGHWLGRDQECAALVQSQCLKNGSIGLTNTWRKGLHVQDHCAQIPTLSAIATFLGPGGIYDEPHLHQHTAIFVRCEANGIRVWDQWNGTPIASRIIPWKGGSVQYTGANFWSIA